MGLHFHDFVVGLFMFFRVFLDCFDIGYRVF